MPPDAALDQLAHAIEIAVAPVFLLMAVGTLLNVLTGRLGRTVDRARHLIARSADARAEGRSPLDVASLELELESLFHRRRLTNYAITCATLAALLVCVLILSVFVAFMLDVRVPQLVAALFIATMAAFIAALVFFLREISHAVKSPGFAPSREPRG